MRVEDTAGKPKFAVCKSSALLQCLQPSGTSLLLVDSNSTCLECPPRGTRQQADTREIVLLPTLSKQQTLCSNPSRHSAKTWLSTNWPHVTATWPYRLRVCRVSDARHSVEYVTCLSRVRGREPGGRPLNVCRVSWRRHNISFAEYTWPTLANRCHVSAAN